MTTLTGPSVLACVALIALAFDRWVLAAIALCAVFLAYNW